MSQVVVVIGGGALPSRVVTEVEADATVIAADSGLDHAVAAGLKPTVLLGDLDSISAHGKMWAYAHELEIEQYPVDKDATDTDLALRRAASIDASDLLVLGAAGDRFDHTLGTIAALGNPTLARFATIRLLLDDVSIHVIHPGRSIAVDLPPKIPFSLLALHGPCRGVEITGARWPLTDAPLDSWSTRGLSNETTDLLQVTVTHGVLTLVVP
ncbi:MAG TPA: thiamine diphosphokinase [Ilumatobacteraceae bacterium]|nr:thiamine diphosphokinase [Ilumatobacteraceae bacterium]